MEDKEFLKRTGLKIKILRTLKNLSQDDISNKLNIDKSYYSKVERGLTNPTLLYLKNIAEVLGTQLEELVNPQLDI